MTIAMLAVLMAVPAGAQRTLSLEECRDMALGCSRELEQARTGIEMAGYDRKTAFANYFPEISATGAYMHNNGNFALVGEETSQTLQNLGSIAQGAIGTGVEQLMTAIKTNPAAAMEYMSSPMWQTFLGTLSQTDISQAVNGIGSALDKELHPDLGNIYVGAVSLTQPLFAGGKIVNSNKVAKLAEDLSRTQYEGKAQEVVTAVDAAYWQIVSVAAKKRLAEEYSTLLHQLEKDVEATVREGVATEADLLQIKVKANEADMLKSQATNGLSLAKMLLCKQIGIELDSDIMLADENSDLIALPAEPEAKSLEAIWDDRVETRSLALASDIYKGKARIAAADMLPTVALTANYLLTNPSLDNGLRNDFSGMFNAGVMVKVPLFHGLEAQQKTRKARAEAQIYSSRQEDAKEMIALQVTQLRHKRSEALENMEMCENNLACAEENLRTATIGLEEGVINANTALAAHTAWLQARSQQIEAAVALQMTTLELDNAQGCYPVSAR